MTGLAISTMLTGYNSVKKLWVVHAATYWVASIHILCCADVIDGIVRIEMTVWIKRIGRIKRTGIQV